ncbi:MAG: hypothetical protein FWD38_08725 [Oscillospiraceae bacterium]|nr:hypothetical protein [Oscillospiraceae bacterium]
MKKLPALILAIVIILSLSAACKNDSTPPIENNPANTADGSGAGNTGDSENSTNGIEGIPQEEADTPAERRAIAEQFGLPYDSQMDQWEPVTFTYFCIGTKKPPPENNTIINIIERITNVKIDFQFYNINYDIALGVMITADDMPDMAYFGNGAYAAIDSGRFLPVDALIEQYAPNLRTFYDPWWDFMKYNDGRVYSIEIDGTLTGTQTVLWDDGSAFWIQKDVLDHFGRAPGNIDEYFDFIREYKELFPIIDELPTIGFSLGSYSFLDSGITGPGYFLAGNADWGGAVNSDGNYHDAVISPAERWTADFNKMWWEKLNSEYRLGSFQRNFLTLSQSNYLSQISEGVVLGMFDQGYRFKSAEDKLIEEGRFERTYLPLALTFPGVSPNYLDAEEFKGNSGIVLCSSISDPVRAIEYLNWIIHEDVQRFLSWGIEGEHYSYNSDGRIERSAVQRELQSDENWVNSNLGRVLLEMMPKMQGSYPSDGNPTCPATSPEEHLATLPEYDRNLFTKLGIYTMAGFWGQPAQRPAFYPYRTMQPEDGSDAQKAENSILNVINGRTVRNLLTAREYEFERRWTDYTDAINRIDQQPLLDFYTEEALKRRD